MEAIAAASSITALLTIAVQSAKIIYDTVVNIRNGPSQLRGLATAVDDLHRMLKQVADIRVEEESRAGSSGDTSGLKVSIKNCAEDLLAVQREIGKLQAVPQDNHLGRTWKQAKSILAKDDIRRLWSIVNHQTVALSLQLNIEHTSVNSCYFSCSKPYEPFRNSTLKNASRLDGFESTLATGLDKFKEDRDYHYSQTMAKLDTFGPHLCMLDELGRAVPRLEERFQEASRLLSTNGHPSVNGIEDRIDKLSRISSMQYEHLLKKLDDLQIQLPTQMENRSVDRKTDGLKIQNSFVSNDTAMNSAFAESIHSLYSFSFEKEKILSSSETERVVNDIDTILDMIGKKTEPIPKKWKRNESHDWDDENLEPYSLLKRSLKKMKGIAYMSTAVTVGPTGQYHSGHDIQILLYKIEFLLSINRFEPKNPPSNQRQRPL
jgi:hypothetical protein